MADEPAKIILGDTVISTVEEPGRKRFFRRKSQRPPLTHCENCGTQLSGMYCPQCGQAAIDYRRSFRHVIVDLLDSFLNWDSKFFHTIALLLTRPWRLTIEFLAGHRVRYLHPARLYLLISIVFFFAATSWIKSIHIDPINLSPTQRAEIRSELERDNVAPEVRAKIEAALGGPAISTEKRSELKAQLKRDDLPEEERSKIEKQLEDDFPPDARTKMEEAMKNLPPETRAKVDQALKQPLEEKSKLIETDDKTPPDSFEKWIEGRARQKFGEAGTNIQLFLVTLISNLPYMMLACVPLFAFVLKILYLRKRIFYIDHLVYAFHIHTFAYLAIMLIVLATMGLNRTAPSALAGWTIALLWTTFAVQIFLSIRRVYRQGWFFSIFKFFVGGVAYLVVLFAALATTFLITLALP
jgi:hypothetical protein